MAAPPSLQASLASLNLSSSDSPLTADQLRLQANALFPSSPASSIPLYTAALSLTPLSAPILANRSAAHLKCRNFVEAYRDAVQALDDKSEGAREVGGGQGERELRVKCVVRAGEACVGAEVWDLGVIHFQEALTLSSSSSSSSSPNAPSIPPNPRIASLRAQALNHLSRASARPDLNRALMERRTAFLAECFPGLQEEEGVEWETDSEEESGSEEEEEESGEEGDEDEDEQMS